MKKILAIAAAALLSSPALAQNLVDNGDFEAGNTGFGTTYTLADGTSSSMVPENTYFVGTNAANYHPSWANVLGNGGAGNYLIANGSPASDAAVWSQTLTGLTIGAVYNFSAFAVNVCCSFDFQPNNSPFIVAVGTGSGSNPIATSGSLGSTGTWTAFGGSFTATATSVDLSIFTDINNASGNDFGLDDISVVAAVPEPATWAMMIFGFGIVGAAMRRRRTLTAITA